MSIFICGFCRLFTNYRVNGVKNVRFSQKSRQATNRIGSALLLAIYHYLCQAGREMAGEDE